MRNKSKYIFILNKLLSLENEQMNERKKYVYAIYF